MTTFTGQGIPLFRLIVLRSGVRAEQRLKQDGPKGLRMFRRSMTALAARELGCKRTHTAVLAALDAAIAAQEARLGPGDITP